MCTDTKGNAMNDSDNKKILTSFKNLVSDGENMIKKLEISKNIYKKLIQYLTENNTSYIDYSKIVTSLFDVIDEPTLISYFREMGNRIAYEWALELYWILLNDLPSAKESFSDTVLARIYLEHIGAQKNEKTEANKFRNNKTNIQKQFDNDTDNLSIYQYPKYLSYQKSLSSLNLNNLKEDELLLTDFFFFVQEHHQSPFGANYISEGMTFTKYYDTISDYIQLHGKLPSDNLKAELSAYICEKLYHSISYERCVLNFFECSINMKKIPNIYWPTHCFCRMYNTHYISLIDYLSSLCESDFSSFWTAEDEMDQRASMYILFELYNSFLLPQFFHILVLVLNKLYEGDTTVIATSLKDFLLKELSDEKAYSFRKDLIYTHNAIRQLGKYLNKEEQYKEFYKMLFPSPKNDRKEYDFSTAFFKCFFHHDSTNLISPYLQEAKRTSEPSNMSRPTVQDNEAVLNDVTIDQNGDSVSESIRICISLLKRDIFTNYIVSQSLYITSPNEYKNLI